MNIRSNYTIHKNPRILLYLCVMAVLILPPVIHSLYFLLSNTQFSSQVHYIFIPEIVTMVFVAIIIYILNNKALNDAEKEIAERKHAEDALRESEQRLMDVINFLPDATFVIDKEKRVLVWNCAMEELTGVKAQDMLGKSDYEYALPFYGVRRPLLIDLLSEEDHVIEKHYASFNRNRDSIIAEAFIPGLKNGVTYLWGIAKPLYDQNGNMIGAIESLRNITERKQAEEMIRTQKEELETVNRELTFTVHRLEETNQEYKQANMQLSEAQQSLVTAHEQLQQSEEKFSKAFRLSPFVLALSTVTDGRYVEVSDCFFTLSGYTREEVIGHTAFELGIWVNPDDRPRILKLLKKNGRVLEEEIQFRAKSGRVHDMLFSAEFVTISQVNYLLSVNVDITDRKQAEETIQRQKEELEAINKELNLTIQKMEQGHSQLLDAQQNLYNALQRLQQSEEKFSKAFHLGPIIITLSTVADGRYVEVSDYFLRLTEYSREEVIGHTANELGIWVNNEERVRVRQILEGGGTVLDEEIPFKSKSGKVFIMLFSAEIITILDEPHLVSVAINITERKRDEEEKDKLEQQLRQAQKMESIGRLAGGVAHDFNNLLTAILGNTDIALLKLDPKDDLHKRLTIVKKAAESAAQLTRQLLAFSRKQIIEPKVIDLNELIERMHKMLRRLIGEDVDLYTLPKAEAGRIKADPGQIEQIIVNLAVNARDAMPSGGKLIIETADAILDESYCRNHAYALPGEYVMLSISDTGTGMSDEVKRHLFEPFFTTKPKGKGTGLGLATVYGVVKQNNGTIEVYSIIDKGTIFKIYLPRVTEEGVTLPVEPPTETLPEGNETILIVEDDAMVLEFASSVLNGIGYHVLQASGGEEAISMAEAYDGKIHVLLTDVILHGMNGKVLADAIISKRPDTKVLFTSGYTEDLIAQHGVLEQGIHFIGKPYAAFGLAKKIREVINKE